MKRCTDRLRLYLADKIVGATSGALTINEVYFSLGEPPTPEMGDLAFPCFALAKTLRKGPPQISQDLKLKISTDSVIESVESAGPYLNFRFSSKAIGEFFLEPLKKGEIFQQKLTEDTPKTMIEYSQPNTHKELHVGHMRNMCLGDAVVRLLRYSGYNIITSTFPGDVGTHVAKCLWYMRYRNQQEVPQAGRGEWLGKMYSLGNNQLEDEAGTEKEEQNRVKLTEILKQLEEKKGEYFDLWKETREWSVALMRSVYSWAEIEFDAWYWESDVDSSSVAYAKQLLAEGKLIVSEGAVGMNLEAEKLGFCLLLKKDGTGLYATKDVELARRKFQEHKIEKSIYVVDLRQALHFSQVFKVLEKIGFSQAKDCYHLQYNFVELPDGAMSSRKGNIVPLMELISQMESMVKEQYLVRYRGEWSDSEINTIATQVAKGAIKFGMLRIDNNKKIVFDMKEWLKLDGESGPFVQYSYARINSLIRKLGTTKESICNISPRYEVLNHPAERQLLQQLINFNTVVVKCAEEYRPSVLCTYLYDTAKRFNYFYHECSIGQAETAELKEARLHLSFATGSILRQGLSLLGIPAPEKM